MKNIIFLTLAFHFAILLGSCHFGNRFSVFSDDDGNGRNVTTMEIDNGNDYVKVKYAGDIVFTEDETAVKSISAGGCLKYWKNGRKFIANSNNSGMVTYQLYDGSNTVSINDIKGKKMEAAVIKDLIQLGFDAKGRVNRLYKNGGAATVLSEIDFLKNDFVRNMYYENLLNTQYLTPAETAATANSIAQNIGGSYEKSQLLNKFADYFLANPQTGNAYLDAVNTIGGDYEKAGTLQSAIKQPLTNAQVGHAITIAGTIGGDYEKANVLKAIVAKKGLVTENCDKLLDVTATIGGDYEKAGVLTELVENDSLSDESFGRLLFVTAHIGGDYEKAGVLKKIAAQYITEPDQWVSLIKAAGAVGAAYEKSGTMVAIAQKMPKDEAVKAAYMQVAKSISGDYEYGQAIKALQQ